MSATREELSEKLENLGIETVSVDHAPVFTVAEAKALRGDLPGGHTKNLFLKDKKGTLWLVITLEDRDVDMKDLRKRIGAAQLSFGKPELLVDVLGVEPGSVTPFALINDTENRVRVVLDAEMMAMDALNFHPLTNAATTRVSPDGLLTFIRSCGHEPAVIEL